MAVVARITNTGAQKIGEQYLFGRFFLVNKFSVGTGSVGCDSTTLLPVVPDITQTNWPSQSALLNLIPAPTSPSLSTTMLGPRVIQFQIPIPSVFANQQISSIGLYATIVYVNNPVDTALIGTQFLHSIANFGLLTVPSSQIVTVTLNLNIY
jgi:hypothetical protein